VIFYVLRPAPEEGRRPRPGSSGPVVTLSPSLKALATMYPALTRPMPPVQKRLRPKDQPLPRDPRHAGQWADAHGTHAFTSPSRARRSLPRGWRRRFSDFTVLPGSRCQDCRDRCGGGRRSTRAVQKSSFFVVPHRGVGAVAINPPKGHCRCSNVSCSASAVIAVNVIQGARMVGSDKSSPVDPMLPMRSGVAASA